MIQTVVNVCGGLAVADLFIITYVAHSFHRLRSSTRIISKANEIKNWVMILPFFCRLNFFGNVGHIVPPPLPTWAPSRGLTMGYECE